METIRTLRQREAATTARRKARASAVAAAVAGAFALWAVVEFAFGVDVRAPAMGGSRETSDVGPAQIVAASGLASLGAWVLLATLERLTSRGRAVWTGIATLALVASLGAPLSGTGVTAGNRIVLLLMHLVVGGVLIPLLYRTSTSSGRARLGDEHRGHRAYVGGEAA